LSERELNPLGIQGEKWGGKEVEDLIDQQDGAADS
jgi:hypothetical protein